MTNATTTPTTDDQKHTQTLAMLNSIVADRDKLRNLVDNRSDLCSALMEDPEYAAILCPAIRAMDESDDTTELDNNADYQLAALAELDSAPANQKPAKKTTSKPNPDARKLSQLSTRCVIYPSDSVPVVRAVHADGKYKPGKPGKRNSSLSHAVELYCKRSNKIYQRVLLGKHQAAMMIQAGLPEFADTDNN